jgi:hypothetical protein
LYDIVFRRLVGDCLSVFPNSSPESYCYRYCFLVYHLGLIYLIVTIVA